MEPAAQGNSGISSRLLNLIPEAKIPVFSFIPEVWNLALITPYSKTKVKPPTLITQYLRQGPRYLKKFKLFK